jgi:hypothetical protein
MASTTTTGQRGLSDGTFFDALLVHGTGGLDVDRTFAERMEEARMRVDKAMTKWVELTYRWTATVEGSGNGRHRGGLDKARDLGRGAEP